VARVTAPERQAPATPQTDFGDKVRAHTRYVAKDGKQVPGVTTIIGVLNKPALVPWANRMGLQGIDTSKYIDEAASIGTLAHALIAESLGGAKVPHDDFTAAQLERAQHGVTAFEKWRADLDFVVAMLEFPLVSETYRFGGTIDCLALINGVLELVDLKTSSGIWPEHIYQVGAYWKLLQEHEQEIKGARILRIGRTEGEGMEEHRLTGTQILRGWQLFEHALAIYRLKKKE
jgi:hypothetical protein